MTLYAPKDLETLKKAMAAFENKDLSKAEKLAKRAVKAMPDQIDALNLLSLVYLNQDKPVMAEKVLAKAVNADNDNAMAWKNYAWVKDKMGDLQEAERAYLKTIELTPDMPLVHHNLAVLYHKQGRFEDAITYYQKSVDAGGPAESAHNIGVLTMRMENYEEAAQYYLDLLKKRPNDDKIMSQLSICLKHLGQETEAVAMAVQALAHNPDSEEHQAYFISALRNLRYTKYAEDVKQVLHYCLAQKKTPFLESGKAWTSLMMLSPDFGILRDILGAKDDSEIAALMFENGTQEMLNDSFLCLGLGEIIIADMTLEHLFASLRRALLLRHKEGNAQDCAGYIPLICALSEHYFFNEYVASETPAETDYISALREKISSAEAFKSDDLISVLLLSCYEELSSLANLKDVRSALKELGGDHSNAIAPVIKLHIDDVLEEQELRSTIDSFGSINDDVSQKVRAQYEENPYPRWRSVSVFDYHSDVQIDKHMMQGDVLVAGCGTGRHSIYSAVDYPKASVTAFDLSLASLAYAKRKSKEYGITNLKFFHGDILESGELGREKFDIVESAGVLHHMKNPMAGWRVLTGLLKPGGEMRIGLYSELARQHIVEMRKQIEEKGFDSSRAGIRAAREYVASLPDGHFLKKLYTSRDYFTTSMCRDLIFHVQEHRFTIPQLKECIAELGLEFLSMQMPIASHALNYRRHFPDDPHFSNLDYLHEYEVQNPDLFFSMYQFRLRKPPKD